MQFPGVTVMMFSVQHFEVETFTEHNLGQNLRKSRAIGSDKRVGSHAAMDMCGKAKNALCLLS